MSKSFEKFFGIKKFDFEQEKEKFIKHMNFLKTMTVQEFTLYKKHIEVGDYRRFVDLSEIVKYKIWKPTDISNKEQTIAELNNLKPVIKFVEFDDEKLANEWMMIRIFCHTMDFDQNPGRFIKFVIIDDVSKKYLGIASLGSDVITITDRDEWIGWTKDNRLKDGKLNNSAIGTCIMATQPFGYNFLGGKLVASLLTTSEVKNTWKRLYNNTLVGLTTTSLYGQNSMYNSIPFWKNVGKSKGKISVKPNDEFYELWVKWLKDNHSEKYWKLVTQKEGVSGPVTAMKQRTLQMIYQYLNIKASDYVHGFERGVYYSLLYENTKEFLQNKIEENALIPSKKLEKDFDSVIEWWKNKAINRYEKLHLENKIKPDILYYNEMIDMSWEETKIKYLDEVGR